MSVAVALLKILVAFLLLASIAGAIAVAVDWWQMRKPLRVPPPPLSNDERIREYERNERAYRPFR